MECGFACIGGGKRKLRDLLQPQRKWFCVRCANDTQQEKGLQKKDLFTVKKTGERGKIIGGMRWKEPFVQKR